MKYILKFLETILVPLLCVFACAAYLKFFAGASITSKPIVIDIAKVTGAYSSVVSKAANNDIDSQISLVDSSKKIKAAIRNVVGDQVVFVSAAIVQGEQYDITDYVLSELGFDPESVADPISYKVDALPEVPEAPTMVDISKVDEFYKELDKFIKDKESKAKLHERKNKVVEQVIP